MRLAIAIFLCYNIASPADWSRTEDANLKPIITMDSQIDATLTEIASKYTLSADQIQRFWSRVDIKGPDDCWDYTGPKDRDGYGRFHAFGNARAAHGIALMIHTGKHWGKLCTCHTCDRPICANPRHLFLGTTGDNNRDRTAKGRTASGDNNWAHANKHLMRRGEQHTHSKLTVADVLEIRRANKEDGAGSRTLARKFSVSQSLIMHIIKRRNWTHI